MGKSWSTARAHRSDTPRALEKTLGKTLEETLEEYSEAYQLDILDGALVKARITVPSTACTDFVPIRSWISARPRVVACPSRAVGFWRGARVEHGVNHHIIALGGGGRDSSVWIYARLLPISERLECCQTP